MAEYLLFDAPNADDIVAGSLVEQPGLHVVARLDDGVVLAPSPPGSISSSSFFMRGTMLDAAFAFMALMSVAAPARALAPLPVGGPAITVAKPAQLEPSCSPAAASGACRRSFST